MQHKHFQKIKVKWNSFKLISGDQQPGYQSDKDNTEKELYRPVSLTNSYLKIFNTILNNLILYIKGQYIMANEIYPRNAKLD